jgi:hypothetical protein
METYFALFVFPDNQIGYVKLDVLVLLAQVVLLLDKLGQHS